MTGSPHFVFLNTNKVTSAYFSSVHYVVEGIKWGTM